MLPGRHLINGSLLGINLAALGGFLAAAPVVPAVAAGYLGLNTLLSFIKGYTLTAAVGGADMRALFGILLADMCLMAHIHGSCRHYCAERVLWVRACCRRYVSELPVSPPKVL
jgi:hypothetical protein